MRKFTGKLFGKDYYPFANFMLLWELIYAKWSIEDFNCIPFKILEIIQKFQRSKRLDSKERFTLVCFLIVNDTPPLMVVSLFAKTSPPKVKREVARLINVASKYKYWRQWRCADNKSRSVALALEFPIE